MEREEILNQIWKSQDEAFNLMTEYDSLPHYYGKNVLYQAEAYVVNGIGKTPNITTTELAKALNKTPSACSQIIRKLIDKGFVEQFRNEENKRQYNLRLTKAGEQMYQDHITFNKECQQITFRMLEIFDDQELATYLKIQKCINEAYYNDVQRSKQNCTK